MHYNSMQRSVEIRANSTIQWGPPGLRHLPSATARSTGARWRHHNCTSSIVRTCIVGWHGEKVLCSFQIASLATLAEMTVT